MTRPELGFSPGSGDEIIFTHGTTESINLVARTWGESQLRPGDEVLLTEMEHHSNIVPWQQAAAKTGSIVRWARIDGSGELDLDDFSAMLNARTKLVAVTAVSNVLGTVNPLEQIVSQAHAAGACVLVDGAQLVGHHPIDVKQLGVDFLAFTRTRCLGPEDSACSMGSDRSRAMPPFLGGGGMVGEVTPELFTTAEIPAKFEAGTPAIAAAIAFHEAIAYLERVDLATIHEHEAASFACTPTA